VVTAVVTARMVVRMDTVAHNWVGDMAQRTEVTLPLHMAREVTAAQAESMAQAVMGSPDRPHTQEATWDMGTGEQRHTEALVLIQEVAPGIKPVALTREPPDMDKPERMATRLPDKAAQIKDRLRVHP
jgi:hypothetical protein